MFNKDAKILKRLDEFVSMADDHSKRVTPVIVELERFVQAFVNRTDSNFQQLIMLTASIDGLVRTLEKRNVGIEAPQKRKYAKRRI